LGQPEFTWAGKQKREQLKRDPRAGLPVECIDGAE
jgi:hypothetical protein